MLRLLVVVASCFLSSCKPSNDSSITEKTTHPTEDLKQLQLNNLLNTSDPTLQNWLSYYQKIYSEVKLGSFKFTSSDSLRITSGHILGNYDPDFDPVYSNFLIHSEDQKKYIDIDSYLWSIGDDGAVLFSADQEINLVDIDNKSVSRVAFRGPSQWVEDAFWQNDETVVLLENNYDYQPVITVLNLKTKRRLTFRCNDKIKELGSYTQLRFGQKGIEVD
jgi:hypothetical protein